MCIYKLFTLRIIEKQVLCLYLYFVLYFIYFCHVTRANLRGWGILSFRGVGGRGIFLCTFEWLVT